MTRGNAISVQRRPGPSTGAATVGLPHAEVTRSAARQTRAIRVWTVATTAAALLLLVLRLVGIAGFSSLVVITVFVVAVGWVAITVLLAPPSERSHRSNPAAALVANSSGKSLQR